MIALGPIGLLRPWWLLALVAVFLLWRGARRPTAGLEAWARAMDPHLFDALARRGRGGGAAGEKSGGGALALAVLVAVLSGPALRRADADRYRNLDATLVLLDLSSAPTLAPKTLAQARAATLAAISAASGRQTGLVLYAGDAYLAAPLTDDAASLTALVFAADASTVPDYGARPDRALLLARDVLHDGQFLNADVALISSGAGIGQAARAAARALTEDGHTLHTIFLANDSAPRAALDALASPGGVSAAMPDIQPVAAALAGRGAAHVAQSPMLLIAWRDFGRWLLPLALAPLFFAFRRAA